VLRGSTLRESHERYVLPVVAGLRRPRGTELDGVETASKVEVGYTNGE
jgi:hypothetical protein